MASTSMIGVIISIIAILLATGALVLGSSGQIIGSGGTTNNTTVTNQTTIQSTTIQSTTITTAITANTCSTSSYAYGISSSGGLSCSIPTISISGNESSVSCEITGTTQLMTGMDITFKAESSSAMITMFFTVRGATASSNTFFYGAYGGGSAPVCSAAETGSIFTSGGEFTAAVVSGTSTLGQTGQVSGLVVGTTYWVDIIARTDSASDSFYYQYLGFTIIFS